MDTFPDEDSESFKSEQAGLYFSWTAPDRSEVQPLERYPDILKQERNNNKKITQCRISGCCENFHLVPHPIRGFNPKPGFIDPINFLWGPRYPGYHVSQSDNTFLSIISFQISDFHRQMHVFSRLCIMKRVPINPLTNHKSYIIARRSLWQ